MNKTGFLAMCLSIASVQVLAQETAPVSSSASMVSSMQGNNQAMSFSSPSDITTHSFSQGTQNIVSSGTTKNVVEYQGTYTLRNVPSVAGPNLTTSNDTCMGSTSAGVNAPGVGVSFGTTWTDEHCKRLKMSRELWNKGMKAASLAMDCMDPGAMAALEMTGTRCPQSMSLQERVAAFGVQAAPPGTPAIPTPAVAPAATPQAAVRADDALRANAAN